MARVRFKNVNAFQKSVGKLVEGAVADRMKQVKEPFLRKLKSYFNGSKPGYPGKLLGWAQRSIYVRQRGKFLLEYGTRGPHAAKIPWLSSEVTISPTGDAMLSIPMSMDAKKNASRMRGPRDLKKKMFYIRTANGNEFLVEKRSKRSQKATGTDLIFHYFLTRGPIRRKAYKGLDDAVEDLMPWLQKKLVG